MRLMRSLSGQDFAEAFKDASRLPSYRVQPRDRTVNGLLVTK